MVAESNYFIKFKRLFNWLGRDKNVDIDSILEEIYRYHQLKDLENLMSAISKIDVHSHTFERFCDLYFQGQKQVEELAEFLAKCYRLPECPQRDELLKRSNTLFDEAFQNFKYIKDLIFDRMCIDDIKSDRVETKNYIVIRHQYESNKFDLVVRKK